MQRGVLSILRRIGLWQVIGLRPRAREQMWLGRDKGKQHWPGETVRPNYRRQDRDKEECQAMHSLVKGSQNRLVGDGH